MTTKKNIKKKLFIILGIAGFFTIALITAVLVIGVPFIKLIYAYSVMDMDTGYNKVDTTLTVEQKISDLDYMYELVCLDNPAKEEMENAYGISYDELYERYREYIVNSESEYEYLAYMANFLAVLPGEHNIMGLVDYERFAANGGYAMSEIYGTQEIKDYTYSWKEDFRDEVTGYLDYTLIGFMYTDGQYIGIAPKNTTKKYTDEYAGAVILSIDGRDPKDMCFDFFERYTPRYDSGNDCFFRSNLIFNDGTGEKHIAEIQLPDGSVVTAELYDDPCFDMAYTDAYSTYPELAAGSDSVNTGGKVTDPSDPAYVPSSYKIEEVPEQKLVYIELKACDSYEGEILVADLSKALENTAAESVIIDIRYNDGGDTEYLSKQLLPVLFSHDVQCLSESYGTYNDHTSYLYKNIAFNLLSRFDYKLKDGYLYSTEDFSVKGKAVRDYKIYVLTTQNTFSAADTLTCICKEYDNATVIGTNTGGEGFAGVITNCYLPESRFMFAYSGFVNVQYPEDSYLGTEPDIYIPYTLEEINLRHELQDQGLDTYSFEVRLMWDRALLKALELAEG